MKPLGEVVKELEAVFKWRRDWRPTPQYPTLIIGGTHITNSDLERLCAAFRAAEKMRAETVCQSCGDTGYVDHVDIGVGLQGIPCGCVSHGPNPLIEAQSAWDAAVGGDGE